MRVQPWLEESGLTLIRGWARAGVSPRTIAGRMGVGLRTLERWRRKYPALALALSGTKEVVDSQVEDALLQQVLEAGRNAPTAHNNQPQRIFVLQSPEAMAKADACMGCHFHPPVLLAVAYDPAAAWDREDDGKNHGEIDATIAVTQMMLQAADLGLGTTYVGMFDPEKLTAAFPEMAGLVPIAMLPLGYPAEGAHPARLHTERKPMEQLVKYL